MVSATLNLFEISHFVRLQKLSVIYDVKYYFDTLRKKSRSNYKVQL